MFGPPHCWQVSSGCGVGVSEEGAAANLRRTTEATCSAACERLKSGEAFSGGGVGVSEEGAAAVVPYSASRIGR
jgi:hypothetical protein